VGYKFKQRIIANVQYGTMNPTSEKEYNIIMFYPEIGNRPA